MLAVCFKMGKETTETLDKYFNEHFQNDRNYETKNVMTLWFFLLKYIKNSNEHNLVKIDLKSISKAVQPFEN